MPHIAFPVPTASAFPASTTVVVIGGGIVGMTAALTLAERGVPVVVLEKGRVGLEQSSRNLGWVRKMGRDSREMPLIEGYLQKVAAKHGERHPELLKIRELFSALDRAYHFASDCWVSGLVAMMTARNGAG